MKEEITFLDMLQQKRTTYEETPAPQALQFGAGGANIIDAGP